MKELRDIFICHASEDKKEIVKPLLKGFDVAKISYWYDEAEIKWGDSITEKVNEGLSISNYVVVVISSVFLSKHWPQRELNAVLNMEASSGEVKVLPLLVGSEEDKELIMQKYPLLNDKRYLSWNNDVEEIVNALSIRLSKPKSNNLPGGTAKLDSAVDFDLPLPIIRKNFTQRDKDKFLQESFHFIKSYFQTALSKIESLYPEIETNFTEIHNFKFLSTIYVNGNVNKKCKIWLGGPLSSDAIVYSEGNVDIENDNSYNDWLTVKNDEAKLGFQPSNMWLGNHTYSEESILSTHQASEYIWKRFIDSLS